MRYGSPEACAFVAELYEFIATEAYKASSNLAAERGSFPAFEAEAFLQGQFAKKLPLYLHKLIREQGLRNATVLTVAPTGTTATMLDISTGIEPHYSLAYERATRMGVHTQRVPLAEQWMVENPGAPLPDHFVTSMEISPAEHVRMQAMIQYWIDAAVSKTINLPQDAAVDDVQKAYSLLYSLGCKGGTVYRDGSLDGQILTQRCADNECTLR
jgi:ribonucleoside-diphosphate reductase alpha chain